jgi:AcrR family transcriptional regulator
MPRASDSARRDALLAAAGDHVLEHGMADLSLRPLAAALGTSPRMLLYHFGSKEQLVADVLAAARVRQAELTAAWWAAQPELSPAELLLRFWRWQIAEHRPFLRLFFEIYGLALQAPQRFPGLPRDAVESWLPLFTDTIRATGVPDPDASLAATIVIATYRGLLLDVLATDDVERTTDALDLFLKALEARFSDDG